MRGGGLPSIAKIFGAWSVRPRNKIQVICRINTPDVTELLMPYIQFSRCFQFSTYQQGSFQDNPNFHFQRARQMCLVSAGYFANNLELRFRVVWQICSAASYPGFGTFYCLRWDVHPPSKESERPSKKFHTLENSH